MYLKFRRISLLLVALAVSACVSGLKTDNIWTVKDELQYYKSSGGDADSYLSNAMEQFLNYANYMKQMRAIERAVTGQSDWMILQRLRPSNGDFYAIAYSKRENSGNWWLTKVSDDVFQKKVTAASYESGGVLDAIFASLPLENMKFDEKKLSHSNAWYLTVNHQAKKMRRYAIVDANIILLPREIDGITLSTGEKLQPIPVVVDVDENFETIANLVLDLQGLNDF